MFNLVLANNNRTSTGRRYIQFFMLWVFALNASHYLPYCMILRVSLE